MNCWLGNTKNHTHNWENPPYTMGKIRHTQWGKSPIHNGENPPYTMRKIHHTQWGVAFVILLKPVLMFVFIFSFFFNTGSIELCFFNTGSIQFPILAVFSFQYWQYPVLNTQYWQYPVFNTQYWHYSGFNTGSGDTQISFKLITNDPNFKFQAQAQTLH